MDHVIFIMSYNSKDMTAQVYESLSKQSDNVFVLENSYIDNERFVSDKTIDLGEKNIGMGGFVDYAINYAQDKENLFVGIFNNDISNISDNFIEVISKYFLNEVGIAHPALDDDGCPYPYMKKWGDGISLVDHVETVAPFINCKVLKEMSVYVPTHFYGWYDVLASKVSKDKLGLSNIIVNDTIIKHERSGVRKKMDDIDGNFFEYKTYAYETYLKWLEKNNLPGEYYLT